MRTILMLALLLMGPAAARSQAPWLPESEQAELRKLIPQGVPFSENAKFYRLPQKFQSLYFLNGHQQRDILPVTIAQDPWRVSGGMHWADRRDWRNIVAMDIPKGKKISIWQRSVDAGAPGPVHKWEWAFPAGTLAYDVLIRTGRPPHRVFEVRVHERLDKGWDHGTTYRPAVELPADEPRRHTWGFATAVDGTVGTGPLNIRGAASWRVVEPIPANTPFEPRRAVAVDGGNLVPLKYVGAGTSCASCHQHAGARTGYGQALRGGDGRFSWHPWMADGRLDWRWPMEAWKPAIVAGR